MCISVIINTVKATVPLRQSPKRYNEVIAYFSRVKRLLLFCSLLYLIISNTKRAIDTVIATVDIISPYVSIAINPPFVKLRG